MIEIYPCDILLQHTGDFFGNIIEKITGCQYSHAAMALSNGLMVHSTFLTGCVIVNFDEWQKQYGGIWHIYRYKKTIIDPNKIISYAHYAAGKKYDWKGVLAFVLPWIKQDSDKYFCSELVAAAYDNANIKLLDKPNYRISPCDLYRSNKLIRVSKYNSAKDTIKMKAGLYSEKFFTFMPIRKKDGA